MYSGDIDGIYVSPYRLSTLVLSYHLRRLYPRGMIETMLHILSKDPGEKPAKKARTR